MANFQFIAKSPIDFLPIFIYTLFRLLAKNIYLAKSPEVIILNTVVHDFIVNHPSFTTDEFAKELRIETPGIGRSTIYHLLKYLCDSGDLTHTSKGHFDAAGKKNYAYDLSATAKEISAAVNGKYPLVDHQIWELYQMNEFVNHQLAKNTIFIEVESMQCEAVFNLLFDMFSHVLYAPDENEYYKYAGDTTVIVQKLITEAPPAFGENRQASLEKMLVDLFGRGLSGKIISRSEYRAIYEDSFRKYNINQAKMFRYARRRGVQQTIKDYISKETSIELSITNDR